MVSSGISTNTNVNPVRTVENSMMGTANGKSASIGFGEFMAQSMSANVDAQKELSASIKTGGNTKVDNTSTDATERIPKKEDAAKTDKAEVKEQVKQNDVAGETESAIRNEIKEKFDVTDEDIDKALEVLGLTMADLLDKINLMDFVVVLTGIESTVDLLVMGDMSANVDELLKFIQDAFAQLAEEYGISTDEMADILDELMADTTNDQDVVIPVTEGEEDKVVVNDIPKENVIKQNDSQENSVMTDSDANTAPEVKIVETKSGSETGNQTFDNQNADAMQSGFVNNLSEAITEAFDVNGLSQQVDAVSLIDQIVENAKLTLNREVTSMEMMLNPESLGKINLNISVREGVVTATIIAQNEAVKEAIENQVMLLKENLNNQGLKVEAVEVTVESHAFEANAHQEENNTFSSQQEEAKKKTNRPLRTDSLEDLLMEELTDEEQLVLDMMVENGNQINFKA